MANQAVSITIVFKNGVAFTAWADSYAIDYSGEEGILQFHYHQSFVTVYNVARIGIDR